MKHVASPATGLHFMLALFAVTLLLITMAAWPADAQAFGSLTENGTAAFMGIGTVPQKILHVSGSGPGSVPLFQRSSDSAGFIIERTPTNRWVLGVNESPALGTGFVLSTIPTGNTSVPRLMITPTGKVGIGTVSPTRKLEVVDTSNEAIYGKNTGSLNYGYLGGSNYGVYGRYGDTGPYGYLGNADYGVQGCSSNSNGAGVSGVGTGGNGVEGETNSGKAVYGINHDRGNEGYLGSTDYAVYGYSSSDYAGYFDGKVNITGNLVAAGDNITGGTTGRVRHFQYMGGIYTNAIIYSNSWADIKTYAGPDTSQRTFGLGCRHPEGCTYVYYLDGGSRHAGNLADGATENITMTGDGSDARFLFGKHYTGVSMLQGEVLDPNGAYMGFIIHDVE
jgi:hypothetical protein